MTSTTMLQAVTVVLGCRVTFERVWGVPRAVQHHRLEQPAPSLSLSPPAMAPRTVSAIEQNKGPALVALPEGQAVTTVSQLTEN
jgi:hypothetical protein